MPAYDLMILAKANLLVNLRLVTTNGLCAFVSCWYGVPALAGEGQDWQANGQGGGAPDRLKPGLQTNNSRMRPNGLGARQISSGWAADSH